MAFRTQKISQMTPKGSDLEATDLIEVSTIESGSYVTRSITGQELIDAIPAPTGFVPTSRTLTINGTTQDLSADRTFTISTGITIGTTLITSGTVGRVLFEGTGNVVQESANLFWDNTNGRLGIGTSSPSQDVSIVRSNNGTTSLATTNVNTGSSAVASLIAVSNTTTSALFSTSSTFATYGVYSASHSVLYSTKILSLASDNGSLSEIRFGTGTPPTERMRINSTGNVLINTTTDAGFRLDVNGTARATKVVVGASTASPYQLNVWGGAVESYISLNNTNSGNLNTDGFQIGLEPNGTDVYFINRENGFIQFRTNNLDRFRIFSTGNVGINTTTDAGFRLDVNGTARVQGSLSLTAGNVINIGNVQALAPNTGNDLMVGFNNSLLTFYTGNNPVGRFFSTGNFAIGTTTDVASSKLTIQSTTQGFLPPRMTTTQKNAIASPATGLQIFDTTLNRPCFYDGTTWITL